jgi:hypothetical protein
VLRSATAGTLTERWLELPENRGLPRGKAHVARQGELAAGARYSLMRVTST